MAVAARGRILASRVRNGLRFPVGSAQRGSCNESHQLRTVWKWIGRLKQHADGGLGFGRAEV